MWYSPTNQILTTDYVRSTWDTRFSVPTGYQRERNLRISSVQTTDAGTYMCKQAVTSTVLNEILLQINGEFYVLPLCNVPAAGVFVDSSSGCRETEFSVACQLSTAKITTAYGPIQVKGALYLRALGSLIHEYLLVENFQFTRSCKDEHGSWT